MKVEIIKYPTEEDWQIVKMLALNTVREEILDGQRDVSKLEKEVS